jgi:hypothetical protein
MLHFDYSVGDKKDFAMVMSLKIMLAALIIGFASWLSGKRPELAGFIIALPLTTLLALAFSYTEYKDSSASVAFAKSIFVGVPVSLLFFIPFLLAERLQLHFWQCYAVGLVLLVVGYFIHRYAMQWV